MRAILTYHSIDDSGSPISVSPDDFARHVDFLVSDRVDVVSLETIAPPSSSMSSSSLPDTNSHPTLAITFDDGFTNFADVAWPRLEAAGLPATVFVVGRHVGRTNLWGGRPESGIPELPLMGWSTLRSLVESGLDIGGHGLDHARLTQASIADVEREVAGSRAIVEENIGVCPTSFCYPYGDWNASVADVVRRHFTRACTTDLRDLSPHDDAMALPRLDAWYLRDVTRLQSFGSRGFRRYIRRRAALRRVRGFFRR